jgi:succinate-acetate transporter protein
MEANGRLSAYRQTQIIGSKDDTTRMVVVRYYLDRPGMDLQHSSARIWKDAPSSCSASDVKEFLRQQSIVSDDYKLLIEIYLQDFMTFMLLEACEEDGVKFDFSHATAQEPAILNVRLTDVDASEWANSGPVQMKPQQKQVATTQYCNTSPTGLFAFSLTIALDTANVFGKLVPGTVNDSFILTFGPYGFFISGLLQLIVGMFEVTRNNIFGATAFMTFGGFWLANGLRLILLGYFPDQISDGNLAADPVGGFIRNFYIFGFVSVLFKQTLYLTRGTSLMVGLLCVFVFADAISGWSLAFQWIQMIFGWMLSFAAFYLFAAEFTNEVYHREVLPMFPWHKDSPDEAFGAAGRINKLQSMLVSLRAAQSSDFSTTVGDVRSVRPIVNNQST